MLTPEKMDTNESRIVDDQLTQEKTRVQCVADKQKEFQAFKDAQNAPTHPELPSARPLRRCIPRRGEHRHSRDHFNVALR